MSPVFRARYGTVLAIILLVGWRLFLAVQSAASQQNHDIYLPLVSDDLPPLAAVGRPLLIDGNAGRIYAPGQVGLPPRPSVVALAASDGRLLDDFGLSGRLALDRTHQRLIVDGAGGGLAIIDANSGQVLRTMLLPGTPAADPQVNPTSGHVYAFRDRTVYVIEPVTTDILQTVTVSVQVTSCGAPAGLAPIFASSYDLVFGKLYVYFVSSSCTPWLSQTIVAIDTATMKEIGRSSWEAGAQETVPYQGSLYGTTYSRLGLNLYWAWSGTAVWFSENETVVGLPRGTVADWGRQRIYEAVGTRIRVVAAGTRQAQKVVLDVPELAAGGFLAGHDPISDQLYFLVDGRLQIRPTTAVVGN